MPSRLVWISATLLLALLTMAAAAGAWLVWRAQAGGSGVPIVNDAVGLMTPEQREFLARYHRFLLRDHDIDYRVETATAVGDVNSRALRRFAELEVGAQSHAGRGLLLLVDAEQDQVRMEVSQSLEGVFPDAFVAYVEHRQMVPFFRDRRVADGVLATTELLVNRVQNAKANAGYESEGWYVGSAGGGATAPARLGAGPESAAAPRSATPRPAVAAASSPEATVRRYLDAMRARNADPELAIYTARSREMLRRWTVTPAQMDNVARTYARCKAQPARYDTRAGRAVIRYPVEQRRCSPWFLEKGPRGWQLDLLAMQRLVRFGRDNSWHFDRGQDNPYAFAFADWRFDARGYPRAASDAGR